MTKPKPSPDYWITVALAIALIAYPISFGPTCWVSSRTGWGYELVPVVYRPMCWLHVFGPNSTRWCIDWYARLGAANGWELYHTLAEPSELHWGERY
jgi:hypothetical protein